MTRISRDALTINEASVIIDAAPDTLRSDINRHIIEPRPGLIDGRKTHVFAWVDLTCLALLYHEGLFVDDANIRKETFRTFRNHLVHLDTTIFTHVDADHVTGPVTCLLTSDSAVSAWENALCNMRYGFEITALMKVPHHGSRYPANSPHDDGAALSEKWLLPISAHVNLDLKPAVDRITPKAELFAKGLDRIETDPERLGGAPVFIGTRLPVHHIGMMYMNGASKPEILEDYPPITDDDVEFAKLYVEANPPKGRPRKEKASL